MMNIWSNPAKHVVLLLLLFPGFVMAEPQQEDSESKSDSQAEQPERRVVTIVGKTKLDVRQWPLLGKPTAKYIYVEMFDYTCSHCRNMHKAIDAAFKKYGDDVAVLALPVPLNASCNDQVGVTESQHVHACDIARLAIAVWRVKPEKFHEYHDWLFDEPRNATEARSRAVKLVTAKALDEELAKKSADKFLEKHVKLYELAGAGSVPKCLFPGVTLTGDIGSARLIQAIEQHSGSE